MEPKIVFRPHQINLVAKTVKDGFDGVISAAAYPGNQIQYTVEGELGNLFIISNSAANPLAMGDSVSVPIDPSDIRLVAS